MTILKNLNEVRTRLREILLQGSYDKPSIRNYDYIIDHLGGGHIFKNIERFDERLTANDIFQSGLFDKASVKFISRKNSYWLAFSDGTSASLVFVGCADGSDVYFYIGTSLPEGIV